MPGKYFDEWVEGEKIEHAIRRTVTETDNLLFSTLTHNSQPLHIDAEAARASEFGQILVNGTFTFSLMIGVTVGDTTQGTLGCEPGLRQSRHAETCIHRRYIASAIDVTEVRASRSRPTAGIVTFEHQMINQRDEIVCSCLRAALLKKSGH